jgi:transposase InsO family protein
MRPSGVGGNRSVPARGRISGCAWRFARSMPRVIGDTARRRFTRNSTIKGFRAVTTASRLMREEQLRGRAPRAFRVTTQSTHAYPIAPNVLARRFDPAAYHERDRAWVGDITYLWTADGWLYLAVLLDVASRRVIGWCADTRLDQSLTLRPLHQALRTRRPAPGLIHHSDRGVQYAATAYRTLLAAHGAVSSMSRRGNCWDNAIAKSFFATLKMELVHRVAWPTRAAAHRDLAIFLDQWYNRQRRHAALGYRTPLEYERKLSQLRIA